MKDRGSLFCRTLAWAVLACAGGFSLSASPIDPATGTVSPVGSIAGYHLAWSDEFNGARLDAQKWGYRTDSKMWSTQLPANVAVREGHLVLTLRRRDAGGKHYAGAGIISRAVFRYGYYEARMKMTPDVGWHTSFWTMLYDGFGTPAPHAGRQELDIMENNSSRPFYYGVNTQSWLKPHRDFSPRAVVPTPDLFTDFHVFGCEFTPLVVRYFFDGRQVEQVDATQFPHGDQNILLTAIASPLGATRAVNDAGLPSASLVDYVRYFAPAATAAKIP